MAKRKIRLDYDDLCHILTDALRSSGYLTEGAKVLELQFQTRTIKEGGWYHELVEPGYDGPVEVVKWIRVLTSDQEAKPKVEEVTDEST